MNEDLFAFLIPTVHLVPRECDVTPKIRRRVRPCGVLRNFRAGFHRVPRGFSERLILRAVTGGRHTLHVYIFLRKIIGRSAAPNHYQHPPAVGDDLAAKSDADPLRTYLDSRFAWGSCRSILSGINGAAAHHRDHFSSRE